MVNRDGFIATMMSYFETLSNSPDFVLLRAGDDERKAFRAELDSVALDLTTGTITADSIANIVSQVRNILLSFTPTFA